MKHPTNSKLITYVLFLSFIFIGLSFNACTEEKNEGERENNPYIVQLGESLRSLQELRDASRFGDRKGNYPPESKAILEDAMADIGRLIMDIYEGNGTAISDEKINEVKDMANKAIADFKATVLTENILYPAELYINGNDDGYIDFGVSDDYINLGTPKNRQFTIETWVKMKSISGGIDAIISTFIEDNGVRCGWMLNTINGNYLRMTYAQKEVHKLWEPGGDFNETNKWVHIAAVYNDKGVDGELNEGKPVVAKYYVNGELKNTVTNGETYEGNYYGGNDNNLPKLPMIAFAQHNRDGSRTRKANGYIKHFHIWNKSKSADELKGIMNGTTEVTGKESDLVCGWPFIETADDDNNIKDLTGRHTAVLRGKYEWQRTE